MQHSDEEAMRMNLLALKGLFDETNVFVQRYSAVILGKLKDLDTVGALIAALKYEDAELRETVIAALDLFNAHNNRADQQFDDHWNLIKLTVTVLDPRLVTRLIQATRNPEPLVSSGIDAAIQRMTGPTVLSFVLAAADPDPYVKESASAQIRRLLCAEPDVAVPRLLGHPAGRAAPYDQWIIDLGADAVPALISMLAIADAEAQSAAERALVAIGIPAIAPLYRRAEEITKTFVTSRQTPEPANRIYRQTLEAPDKTSRPVSESSENTLTKLSAVVDRLRDRVCSQHLGAVKERILNCDDPVERLACLETFMDHEGAFAVRSSELFAALLVDHDASIRNRATFELAKQRDPRVIPSLVKCIDAPSDLISPQQAIALLAPFHTIEVTRALVAALDSPTGAIVATVLEALEQHQNQASIVALIEYCALLSPSARRRLIYNDVQSEMLGTHIRSEMLGTHLDRIIVNLGPKIIDACIECFANANATVRLFSIRLVVNHNDPRAIRALIAALDTGDRDLINEAQKGLSANYNIGSVPKLLHIADTSEHENARSAANRILGIYFTNKISGEAALVGADLRPEERYRILAELHNRGRLGATDVVSFCTRFMREHPDCKGAREVIAHQSHLRPAVGGASATPTTEMVRPADEPDNRKGPFWQR